MGADKEEEEDLDALLEEAGMKVEPEAKAESKKKGKKGKQAKQEDEDDAVFDEFKEKPPETQPPLEEAPSSKEEPAAAKSSDAPEAPDKKQDEGNDEEGDGAVDA